MIAIGLVDDHVIVRTSLKQFLSDFVDLRVIAESSNGTEAIEMARNHPLDVVIMDLTMPGQSGLDAMSLLVKDNPNLGVLVFTGHPEDLYAVSVIRKGASGFLNKECDPKEIVEAIRTIALGRRYISKSVADLLATNLNRKSEGMPHEMFSPRETEVFLRLARGETTGSIAESLSISVKTISTYRTRLLEKIRLNSNCDLTYYALKNGLIE